MSQYYDITIAALYLAFQVNFPVAVTIFTGAILSLSISRKNLPQVYFLNKVHFSQAFLLLPRQRQDAVFVRFRR
jgi:hypothetical protein